jgi:hypothetical protein
MVASLVVTDQINALLLQLIRIMKPASNMLHEYMLLGCIFKARVGGVS